MGRRRKAWLPNGTGKIFNKNKPFPGYYVFYNEYTSPGKKISRSKHFLSQAAAKKWCRIINAHADLRATGDVVAKPIDDAMTEFIGGLSALSTSTRRQYREAVTFLYKVSNDVMVHQITGKHIDLFIEDRTKDSRPATVSRHLRALRRFFGWCKQFGYMSHNPLDSATSKPERYSVRQRPIVNDEQLGKLIHHCATHHQKLAVKIALTTALDRGVITSLTKESVDIDNRCIRIQRPKSKSQIISRIHPSIFDDISQLTALALPRQPLLSSLDRNRRKSLDWFHVAADLAGVPDLKFADLRAIASARMQRVLPLTAVQKILGHSTPLVTARHYSQIDPNVSSALDSLPIPVHSSEPSDHSSTP